MADTQWFTRFDEKRMVLVLMSGRYDAELVAQVAHG